MTKPFGLNVSFKTAAQLVKMPGSFTCAGGGVSDVCNGLLAKQNSVVFKPIVVLAIKYMWAVKSKTPISASLLGYEGANAETLIVDKKPGGGGGRRTADSQSGDGTANWNGICPFILPTMKEKFEHMARLPTPEPCHQRQRRLPEGDRKVAETDRRRHPFGTGCSLAPYRSRGQEDVLGRREDKSGGAHGVDCLARRTRWW